MNLNVSGKNIQITEGLKSYVGKKMERVKYYFPHLIDVHVIMEVEKISHKIEITIKADGKIFHSEFKADDMYESIDGLIDRVESQIKKYKDKLHNFKPDKVAIALVSKAKEQPELIFTKIREIMPKPMSDEEALLQLQASDFKFHIYKKSVIKTEEDYKKLLENNFPYQKSVIIKEDKKFIIIRKLDNSWEEETVRFVKDKIKSVKKQKDIFIEEKSIVEAVNSLIEQKLNYYIFYDSELKNLSIVYKRKNNTLGLITSAISTN